MGGTVRFWIEIVQTSGYLQMTKDSDIFRTCGKESESHGVATIAASMV
jgi:hypothetical protein